MACTERITWPAEELILYMCKLPEEPVQATCPYCSAVAVATGDTVRHTFHRPCYERSGLPPVRPIR